MSQVCFIIPYFGKFPNYFQLFLNSCAENRNYEWLIFTDNMEQFKYPKNVKKVNISFDHLKNKIQKKFDFKIKLSTPKKLCDYKPAYGYIFEEYISSFKYWGHCDIDIILGNLDHYLPKLLNKNYDKLFTLGHFILYKNTFYNNRKFMEKYKGKFLYKDSFTTDKITVFDETFGNDENINSIFLSDGSNVFEGDYSFNVKVIPTEFTQIKYSYKVNKFNVVKLPKEKIMIRSKDGLFEYYSIHSNLKKLEFMYIHLQQRKMKLAANILQSSTKSFAIIPNEFYTIKSIPQSNADLKKLKKRNIVNFHRLRLIIKWKIIKIKKAIMYKESRDE